MVAQSKKVMQILQILLQNYLNTDTDSGMDGSDSSDDGDEIASVSGNVNGVYLAAVMNPILTAAVNTGDISEAAVYQEEDSVESDVAKDDDADTQSW